MAERKKAAKGRVEIEEKKAAGKRSDAALLPMQALLEALPGNETPDRLNDHVKRVTGVTAGHLIRRRILTEAKRELVFANRPIHDIAFDLGFIDPSHFARFFRKQTGTTPQDFRAGRG